MVQEIRLYFVSVHGSFVRQLAFYHQEGVQVCQSVITLLETISTNIIRSVT